MDRYSIAVVVSCRRVQAPAIAPMPMLFAAMSRGWPKSSPLPLAIAGSEIGVAELYNLVILLLFDLLSILRAHFFVPLSLVREFPQMC